MTIPAALTEAGGDKLLSLLYDNSGTNAWALFRSVAKTTLNGEPVAHLAVGTHANGDAWGSQDPVAVAGGSDGSNARALLIDSTGRIILRPAGIYDAGGGSNGYGYARLLGQDTLNSIPRGWMGHATHTNGATFGSTDGVAVISGVNGTTVTKAAVGSDGKLAVNGALTLGGQGAKAISSTGVAVALKTTTTCRRVRVKAHAANSGIVYLGTSTVTNNTAATGGFQLSPGEDVEVDTTDLASVYINGTAADGASFVYWT